MKHIVILFVFFAVSMECFSQSVQNSDSLREARMKQLQQMMQEQQQQRGGAVGNATVVQPRSGSTPQANVQQQIQGQPVVKAEVQTVDLTDDARLKAIRTKLDTLASTDSNYAKQVEELSVSGLSLSELLRNIAKVYDVNISVKGAENIIVTSNFSRTGITDLIYFLCREYNLDIDVVGNIVSIRPVSAPVPKPKTIDVTAGAEAGTISYDLTNDRLSDVMKLITAVGRVNFIIPNALNNKMITGHGRDMSIDDAITAITSANGLVAHRNGNGIWEIADSGVAATGSYRRQSAFDTDRLFVDSLGLITAHIARGNVVDIITDLCETQGLNYFFITPVNHTIPLNVTEVTFESLLGIMFSGTEYGYYFENGIYFFGTFNKETLSSVRVIPMTYRSISKIEEIIPAQLKDGLEVKTFVDLNSIIASGDQRKVLRLENFLKSIDVRVPLVTIEVMIVDATKTEAMEAGLGIGIGDAPTKTSGKLSPGVDMTLGASSINSIISSLNGFGSINLGRVTPQFYMDLKMLEDNGTIQMQSTPKLSTLNGNPANLKSGEKNYYKEVQTNYWGSQTPTPSESYVWKEIEANLEINITPFVSTDGLITLDIEIIQSEFTERVEEDGPIGMATRSFKSIIRVGNEEMVLLGGIDRNSKTIANSGLPFIARVPVLKWIFGKSKKEKKDHKLNVFIKPTLIE